MIYHNIHTHIFTMDNSPKDFLSLYMPTIAANTIESITSTKAGSQSMIFLLNKFGGSGGKKYASFLNVGKSSGQKKVFEDLILQYDDSSIKITALTLNMEHLGAGESPSKYEGQLEEIIRLKKEYPDKLLPFFSLDPRWKNTGEEIKNKLREYFENKVYINAISEEVNPFVGIKLYPSTGFYIFDQKLKASLQWIAENNIPIMTHCSYLGGIFNNDRNHINAHLSPLNPYTSQTYPAPRKGHELERNLFKRIINLQKANNNKYYCSYFLEPASYRSVLSYFRDELKTPLKICFAHYGGSDHMLTQHRIERGTDTEKGNYYGIVPDKNWCAQIQELMMEFETVYTDISYSLTDEDTHEFIFSEIQNKPYRERILFGTDFFMTEREGKEKETYLTFKKKAQNTLINQGVNNTTTVWDMMAGTNIENFLKSTFY